MYKEVHDKVLEAIMTVALNQIMYEEDEACPSDEELAKTYPTSKKMMRKYRNKVKERWYRNPLPVVYLKRVSIIALAVISVMFGVLSTSGEVRAAIVNTVVTWYDKYVQIDFSKTPEKINDTDLGEFNQDSMPKVEDMKLNYIPENFELASSNETIDFREYIYYAESGDYLFIGIYSSESTESMSDIEYMDYENITINGNDAYLLYNDQERTGSIYVGNKSVVVSITAICDKSELIKVAENIK